MQQTAFVCLEEDNIRFYAAIMETFQIKTDRYDVVIRSFLQRLSPISQRVGSFPTIENTYSQLM